MQTEKLCKKFGIEIIAQKEITKGIINSTKLVTDKKGNQYILQEINSEVFKNIDRLMENIVRVSEHIHKMHKKIPNSIDTLNLIKSGKKFYATETDKNGKTHFFRLYKYISDVSAYDEASEKLLFEAGVGFGNFQKLLQNFPADSLFETIPNFHNTPIRYENFLQIMNKAKTDCPERLKKAKQAIEIAKKNSEIANIITGALSAGKIPFRVVHNDTKLNNIMLSNFTHKPVAVIDLDTVMPGSLLFDYGDAIRYCASSAAEDETDLKLINVDFEKVKAFTKGYLSQTYSVLTQYELKLMAYAPEVIAFELGIRFLTDYLQGDVYFKINSFRPDHNLERAMNQFTLLNKFKKHHLEIEKIINNEYLVNIKNNNLVALTKKADS